MVERMRLTKRIPYFTDIKAKIVSFKVQLAKFAESNAGCGKYLQQVAVE